MQDVAVLLEHVDLLDAGNGLHAELLERRLELAVVALLGRDRLLDLLAARGALAACGVSAGGGVLADNDAGLIKSMQSAAGGRV